MIESLGIRERSEAREEGLSPFAARSRHSRGRERPEEPCPMRTAFQRDRDRILYSKAFRRLKHKTQVFIAPLGDHYVTRLTHTLEVAQVARSMSRALILNEDLAEAISLGHDLGHTPFGHVGEETLNRLCTDGFRHNEQSLRVVDLLENNGHGLNLTWEVREGILRHSKGKADVLGPGWGDVSSVEAELCKIADVVAYINHDAADAIRAGIISESDIPPLVSTTLGGSISERINTTIADIVEHSWAATGATGTADRPVIGMSPLVLDAVNLFRQFLFERVYEPSARQEGSLHAMRVVSNLFNHFTHHPADLPQEFAERADKLERKVADYIACMTDYYALRKGDELVQS
ncbi:MAG: deoxyguanosinetriphosphate triphosphohydrolase, partial [Chloroflexi bacterium]|nr:deoxyguanosinetriphosphate triphosphohydrolase [Chloroflexota bacterium]